MLDRHTNRKAYNFVDLTGREFGYLTVLSDTGLRKSRRPIWLCRCSCGNECNILGRYLTNGDTKSCGCYAQGNAHNRDAVGEITLSFWTPIVRQAKRRGIPFEITREQAWALFLQQERKCALTGVKLTLSTNIRDQRGMQTASLDRTKNELGYTLSNVQWVHKRINIMKNVVSNEELIQWCRLIVKKADSV